MSGRCLQCEEEAENRFIHREVILLAVLVVITIGAFFLTRRLAADNEALRLEDAKTWHTQGERELQRGDARAALVSLRRATAKSPDDPIYRLSLARALIADHQEAFARQVLVDLRQRQPEDAETNLQLARLEARRGDVMAAGRYYETAIVALWPSDQRAAQQHARTEFIEFLLAHDERDRALSELLVLEASLPDDVSSHVAVGRMLLTAGDPRRAGVRFEQVLRREPNNPLALAGAGESRFALADYARARLLLNRLEPATEPMRALRTLTNLILDNDPLAPRLRIGERRRRLAVGVAQAIQRLDACLADAPSAREDASGNLRSQLADLRAFQASLTARRPPDSFDDIEAGFDLAYRSERNADQDCGVPGPLDHALVLIGRRHGLDDR